MRWTIKKAECWRTDAFQLWYWRRLLRVPWSARRSNQSILKEISPKLEGLMLKLKLQYFGHLMRRANSSERPWCWQRLKAGGERDNRGWDGWMASLTRWTWVWVHLGSWWWTGRPGVLQSMKSQRVGHDWLTELNWTGLNWTGPRYSPGQNTGVCSCSILQGIFLTQGSNPGFLHWRQILYQLSHQGSSQPVLYYKTEVNCKGEISITSEIYIWRKSPSLYQ